MSEQAGILQAIVENPDDITHRLVYADWLDDHGQSALAGFIRAQCALRPFLLDPESTQPGIFLVPETVGRYPLAIEVMQVQPDLRPGLLTGFRRVYEFLADPAPLDVVLAQSFSFWIHRGFVEDVVVYGQTALSAFLDQAATIFACVPLLHLTVSRAATRDYQFNQYGYYPTGVGLDVVFLDTVGALLETPEAARLRSLDLRGLQLGDDLGRALLTAPKLPGLQRLLLDGNQIGAEMTEQLRQRFGSVLVLQPYDPDDIPF